jgi:hypothetical protein
VRLTPPTVPTMRLYVNSDRSAFGNGNAVASPGGSTSHFQNKTKQVCANEVLDVNNQVAFLP